MSTRFRILLLGSLAFVGAGCGTMEPPEVPSSTSTDGAIERLQHEVDDLQRAMDALPAHKGKVSEEDRRALARRVEQVPAMLPAAVGEAAKAAAKAQMPFGVSAEDKARAERSVATVAALKVDLPKRFERWTAALTDAARVAASAPEKPTPLLEPAAPAPPPAAPPPSPAPSLASASPQRSAYALVIGIERYRDLPSPGGARADAEAFAAVARQTLGIPDANIHVLLDDRATRGDLMKSFEWLKTNVPPNGRVYFFYSGHGAPDPKGASFLVPYDGDPKYLATTALAMNDVMAGLSATKAREVVALVDSCFSGSGGRSVLPPGARPLMRVKESAPQAHLALLTSAGADEIAGPAQGGANGVFSKHLIDGLGRGMADLDGDGQITIDELFTYVKPRVTREAKLDHREQTPTLVVGKGVVAKDVAVAWNVSR